MANHYFKDRDSYFKFVDETHEVVCVTTNFTNKCIAISFTEADGYEQMKAAYTDTAGEIISEELFEAKTDEVKDYITENL
tara:strand:+ start:228 stop:467 length:240 start_codon:yes stop_codon:yes gene_type:complete